ncbi:MAG: ParB/RepB/Spo0J family partition protein [Candidatus Yanofskybacteria bacterium]|nr:ParB/RepB/Spo0J family partition protein [Candidatus Yanofskybacteria bacterium]
MATFPERMQEGPLEGALVVPCRRLRPFPGQPRKYFDPKGMHDLAASIEEVGQQKPLLVRRVIHQEFDFEIIDGERRWRACKMINRETVLVVVTEVSSRDEQFMKALVSNFGDAGHTTMEIAHALERMMHSELLSRHDTADKVRSIARICARSEGWVYQYLGLLRLHPDIQRRLEPTTTEKEQLSLALAVFISSLPVVLQLEVVHKVTVRNLKLSQARALARNIMDTAGLEGRRPRKPSDDFRVFSSFFKRLHADADIVLDIPHQKFQDMLKKRTPERRNEILEEIEGSIEKLRSIKEAISRIS